MKKQDEMFSSALEAQGLKRTKSMYERASLPHMCGACLEESKELGYRLRLDFVTNFNTPYLYICNECYEELQNE